MKRRMPWLFLMAGVVLLWMTAPVQAHCSGDPAHDFLAGECIPVGNVPSAPPILDTPIPERPSEAAPANPLLPGSPRALELDCLLLETPGCETNPAPLSSGGEPASDTLAGSPPALGKLKDFSPSSPTTSETTGEPIQPEEVPTPITRWSLESDQSGGTATPVGKTEAAEADPSSP